MAGSGMICDGADAERDGEGDGEASEGPERKRSAVVVGMMGGLASCAWAGDDNDAAGDVDTEMEDVRQPLVLRL